MNKFEYIVSGCLAGHNCRYDGGSNPCQQVVELVKKGVALPICPESLSGLPSPRPPCEQLDGHIISKTGINCTEAFEKGASRAFRQAITSGARKAILKSRSPSCGYGQIYDGSFQRRLCAGNGIFAQKLADAGFEIFSEDNLPLS